MNINIQNHCIDFSRDLENDGSIIAISNSAGGGHVEATKAVCAQFFQQKKAFEASGKKLTGSFKTRDIFRGSFPPLINRLFAYSMTYHWNKAKREGNIEAQERLYNGKIMGIAKNILVDWILFIPVFVSTFFRLLFNRKVSQIVITQPLGMSGIMKAVRLTNYLFSRKVRVSIVLTDLPTEGSIHYSRPLKNLSSKDKENLKIMTTKPLILNPKETEVQWWKRVYGLTFNPDTPQKSQVLYREFPLRPAFLKWRDMPADQRPEQFEVKVNNSEEQRLINGLFTGQLPVKRLSSKGKKVIQVNIDPKKEVVGLVTIGSQAAKKIKDYVLDFIEVTKNLPTDRQYTLFAACGRHTPGEKTLFKSVYDASLKAQLPPNIRIIPMGYQDDDELAPLMHRMDFGVGSTGGLTSFELLRTAKNKIFLHSEADPTKPLGDNETFKNLSIDDKQKQLLQGFSLWEKWNALYQIYERGAEIVTPGTNFKSSLQKLINNNV